METDDLIRRLAADATPVRPLPAPWLRTTLWLALASPYVATVVLIMSPRADLADKLTDTRFIVEQAAALVTAFAAALAAFTATVPGRSRTIALLPLVPLALWLGSLGQGCVQVWLRYGAAGLTLRPDWTCFPAIALVGAVPVIVIVAMLQRGVPLSPRTTMALAALAAAALGNFGLRLFHPQDASIMVLVWQFGSVAMLTALAGSLGRSVLCWRGTRVSRPASA